MEKREILIASTRTQKQYKVNTDATTLAELKAALDANVEVTTKDPSGNWVPNDTPVDYTDLSFMESLSHTQLIDDASQLPQNVNYKGQVTNNLVMVLTNTRKNVASGMTGTRKEAYEMIKENGLQAGIEEEFGYNYTNVATADLWEYITDHVDEEDNEGLDEDYDEDEDEEVKEEYVPTGEDLIISLYDFIKLCCKAGTFSKNELSLLADLLTDYINMIKETESNTVKVGNIEVDIDELMNI